MSSEEQFENKDNNNEENEQNEEKENNDQSINERNKAVDDFINDLDNKDKNIENENENEEEDQFDKAEKEYMRKKEEEQKENNNKNENENDENEEEEKNEEEEIDDIIRKPFFEQLQVDNRENILEKTQKQIEEEHYFYPNLYKNPENLYLNEAHKSREREKMLKLYDKKTGNWKI